MHSLVKIWYQPRVAVRELIASGRAGHGVALVISSVFGVLQAARFYLSVETPRIYFLFIGALVGIVALFLFSWLLRNFGRWFGATASLAEVRTAVGCSLMPWTFLFGVFVFALFVVSDAAVVSRFYFLFFVGLVYGYIVLLLSIASALQLSIMKAFMCLVVTILFSLFPITMLIQFLSNTAAVTP